MDNKERASLIRRGNELFNAGDYKNALKIFLVTDYNDGIIRIADHLYYEKHENISAIKLYKKAGLKRKVEEFAEKSAIIIQLLLHEDQKNKTIMSETAITPPATETKNGIQNWQPIHIKSEEIMGQIIKGKDGQTALSEQIRKEKKK